MSDLRLPMMKQKWTLIGKYFDCLLLKHYCLKYCQFVYLHLKHFHFLSKLSTTTGGAFHKQIRTPTPVKQETSSCVNNLFSSVPPLWTPLALKEASVDQQNSTPKLCDNDIKTCTSQVAAIDLSMQVLPLAEVCRNTVHIPRLARRLGICLQ
jgi:hypothetical protein